MCNSSPSSERTSTKYYYGYSNAARFLDPFPISPLGNKYLLVAMDYFTKWAEAYPVANMEAVTVATVLTNEMFLRFSPPEQLHSDQRKQFDSQLVKEVCRILQIRTSPQCDGLVERYNRTLLDMLATCSKGNANNWENYVRPVCYVYNTSVQSSTGYTPHFLMFGREARLPVDLQFGTSFCDMLSSDRGLQNRPYAYQLVRETIRSINRCCTIALFTGNLL